MIDGEEVTDQLAERQVRDLFAYLVLSRLQPVSLDSLQDVLAESDDDRFAESLESVRAAVGRHLEGHSELQLRLPVGSVVDVETASEAVHRAEAAVARQDWERAWPAGRVALHVVRRAFLPGSDGPWVLAQRNTLRLIEVRAHECVAMTGLGMGGPEVFSAERSGRALIRLDPIRESGYRFAMEAAARQGNDAEATKLYNELRTRLRDELGIEPGATTREVYGRIVTGNAAPSRSERITDGPAERTFMFTDIVSSTQLLDAVGDIAWDALVAWHDRTLRGCFEAHRGLEVDHAGDGFFVAFEAGEDAIACSIAIQRRLDDHRRDHGFAPPVRIGLHSTNALEHDGKYVGRGVHEAARIGGLAEGGQIVASLRTMTSSSVSRIDEREATLKGIPEPLTIVTLEWRRDPS